CLPEDDDFARERAMLAIVASVDDDAISLEDRILHGGGGNLKDLESGDPQEDVSLAAGGKNCERHQERKPPFCRRRRAGEWFRKSLPARINSEHHHYEQQEWGTGTMFWETSRPPQ